MTREEFDEQITTITSFVNFCLDNGYDSFCDDIYDSDTIFGDVIYSDINTLDWSWRDLRSALDDVDDGYDWYRIDGALDYEGLTDTYDLDGLIDDLMPELEAAGFFDEEEEEDDDEEDEVEETEVTSVNGDTVVTDKETGEILEVITLSDVLGFAI